MRSESSDASDAADFEAILAATTALVLASEAPAALAEDPRAWLRAHGVAEWDGAALAALGDRRLLLYRRHVRSSVTRGVTLEIPRTAARLGDGLSPWIDRWLAERGPRSPYFRDLAFEFVAFAAPLWRADPAVPAYLADLARHELAYFEVASSQDAAASSDAPVDPASSTEIELDRAVRFAASARLYRYEHAVHEIPESLEDRSAPASRATALFAYRDADHDVRFLELTPLAARIVERLLAGDRLGAAVTGACADLGSPLDASVTAGAAAVLEDLVARGAVLGGMP